MKKKRLLILIFLVFTIIVAITICFFLSNKNKVTDFKIQDEKKRMEEFEKEKEVLVSGWLRVEGTNIDLPLLITILEESKLKFTDNYAWTDAVIDENSNHPTYLSHNIRNVSSNPIKLDKTMTKFEQLMSFIYPDVVKENQFVEYTNIDGETSLYRIYGVTLIKIDQGALSLKANYTEKEQKKYIEEVKKNSMYDMNIDVDENDLLLTLSTCTRFYGNSDYYFQVETRKLRDNEKARYANVKTNKNYEKIENRMKEGASDEEV